MEISTREIRIMDLETAEKELAECKSIFLLTSNLKQKDQVEWARTFNKIRLTII